MEHMQNFKKWFELKTELGKNCTTDKFNSEGWPNICGMQADGYIARISPDFFLLTCVNVILEILTY
jgi:hypothetical protein